MNERQRFDATMHYRPRDRAPLCDFNFWRETIDEWHAQGLPASVNRLNSDEFFGMDGLGRCVILRQSDADFSDSHKGIDPEGIVKEGIEEGIKVGLCPRFEERVIEDRGDTELVQQTDGVRVLRGKQTMSIPSHQSHLLTDRDSWRKHYLPRLDPTHPDRLPTRWDRCCRVWTDPERDYPLFLPGGSLYGWIRNWMGLEAVSYVVFDDPAWFEEMVTTIADCVIGTLQRVLETGGKFEACGMWEDMCFSNGPLLSPVHFQRFLVPHYRRITQLLHKHHIDVVWVDSDGVVDELVPHWLEAGVNCLMPIEVGKWGADPLRFRARFGKDLLMMGGFDKNILARTTSDIEREVHRLAPLVEEGGYIGFCDHRVPPNVSLKNYVFFIETIRKVWGKDVNLKPLGIDLIVAKGDSPDAHVEE